MRLEYPHSVREHFSSPGKQFLDGRNPRSVTEEKVIGRLNEWLVTQLASEVYAYGAATVPA
jgi:hypothetical protein